ncbi:MAG: peptide chain release factor 1 [Christensenellales bacterium]
MWTDQLRAAQARYEEVSQLISRSEVIADQSRWQALVREHAALEEIARAWADYERNERELAEAEQMAQAEEGELKQLALEEARTLRDRQEELTGRIQLLLLPKDPDADRSVMLEIRAGVGGEEAALFAMDLMRMYTRYAQGRGWKVESLSTSLTELGGVKEAILAIRGPEAYRDLQFESGVHRVQRVPATEAGGRIHTSSATVAVLPEAEEVEVDIDPNDVRVDVYRSSGHGGQSVNTTDSAVRVTHLPTGMVVTCQDEKSQLKNRDKALRVLRSRLLERMRTEQDAAYAQRRRDQLGSGDRSERIRTYNFPQNRVTDHRIGLTLYRLDAFIQGDMGEMIQALVLQDQARRLEQSGLGAHA